jgi:hypothetical protein
MAWLLCLPVGQASSLASSYRSTLFLAHRPKAGLSARTNGSNPPPSTSQSRQASRGHPRGKPGFSTFESRCGGETDSPLEKGGLELLGPASKSPFQDSLLRFPGVRQCRSRGGPVARTNRHFESAHSLACSSCRARRTGSAFYRTRAPKNGRQPRSWPCGGAAAIFRSCLAPVLSIG